MKVAGIKLEPSFVIEYWQLHTKLHPDVFGLTQDEVDALMSSIGVTHHDLHIALNSAKGRAES